MIPLVLYVLIIDAAGMYFSHHRVPFGTHSLPALTTSWAKSLKR
ncbi:hypothetical protein [Ferrimicrobium sp.]|nr:hypothetical protein [Ferrimicrobium sp.]